MYRAFRRSSLLQTLMSKLPESPAIAASPDKSMWSEIPRDQLPYWNDRLLQSNAPVQQYPFWNAPFERLFLTPRHLAWGTPGDACAYACILTVGFRGFRIGLVFRGPASLVESQPVPAEAIVGLSEWAAREGYVFLRLSPPDESTFATAASTPAAACEDFFPFYLDDGDTCPELVVEQKESDDAMLSSFDREARRKIRRALESGCEIRISDSEQALAELWPLYAPMRGAQAISPGAPAVVLRRNGALGPLPRRSPLVFCVAQRPALCHGAGGARSRHRTLPNCGAGRGVCRLLDLNPASLGRHARHAQTRHTLLQPGPGPGNIGPFQAAVFSARGLLPRRGLADCGWAAIPIVAEGLAAAGEIRAANRTQGVRQVLSEEFEASDSGSHSAIRDEPSVNGAGKRSLVNRLQFFARLKAHGPPGRDGNFVSGPRVPPNAGLPRTYGEHAKSTQLNALAIGERPLHGFKYGLNRQLSFRLGVAGARHHFVDDVQFDHEGFSAASCKRPSSD